MRVSVWPRSRIFVFACTYSWGSLVWAINDTTIAKLSSCTSKLQWKITESMVKIPVGLWNLVRCLYIGSDEYSQVFVDPKSDTRTRHECFQTSICCNEYLFPTVFCEYYSWVRVILDTHPIPWVRQVYVATLLILACNISQLQSSHCQNW
jgi:hypothetical protein